MNTKITLILLHLVQHIVISQNLWHLLIWVNENLTDSTCTLLATCVQILPLCILTLRIFGCRGYYAANMVYLCSIIIFLFTVLIVISENMTFGNIKLFQKSWIILTLLLHRTVNIPMMALMLLTEYFVSKVFVDSLLMITTYYWLGQASFFYQVGVCCLYNLSFCDMLPFENFKKWLSVVCPTFICATLDKRWMSLYL